MLRAPLIATLALVAGCSPTEYSTSHQVLMGARQDSNTEIPGKPQGASDDGEARGVGYNQPGGEMSATAAERAATNQVHYHYHVHVHHPAGSNYEIPGPPSAAQSSGEEAGYANPTYTTHIHHSGFNFYANPYSVPTSPYAHSPNDGNSKVSSYPYYSNIPGMGRPYGVGGYGYGSGGFNPYANDGAGAFEW